MYATSLVLLLVSARDLGIVLFLTPQTAHDISHTPPLLLIELDEWLPKRASPERIGNTEIVSASGQCIRVDSSAMNTSLYVRNYLRVHAAFGPQATDRLCEGRKFRWEKSTAYPTGSATAITDNGGVKKNPPLGGFKHDPTAIPCGRSH
jgi:hypothetical protein